MLQIVDAVGNEIIATIGAHNKEDRVEDQRKHNDKIKKNRDCALNQQVCWQPGNIGRDHKEGGLPAPSEKEVGSKYLGADTKLPRLAIVKEPNK